MKDRIKKLENYVKTNGEKPEEQPLCVEYDLPKEGFYELFDTDLPPENRWHKLEQTEKANLVHSLFYSNEKAPKDKHHQLVASLYTCVINVLRSIEEEERARDLKNHSELGLLIEGGDT